MVGRSWKPYKGQAVSGELDLMFLIGGAQEPTYCLPYIKALKNAKQLHVHPEDGNCSVCRWIIFSIRCGLSSKAEVVH
jgi:hypothetical protein